MSEVQTDLKRDWKTKGELANE